MADIITIEGIRPTKEKKMSRRGLSYAPIEDLLLGDDSSGGGIQGMIDKIATPEQIKGLLTAAGAGAGAIVAGSYLVSKIEKKKTDGTLDADSILNTKWFKAGVLALAGLVGGRLLWDKNRNAALGIASAAAGLGLAEILKEVAGKDATSGLPVIPVGLGSALPYDAELVGLLQAPWRPELHGVVTAEQQRLAGVQISVEEDETLGEHYLNGM